MNRITLNEQDEREYQALLEASVLQQMSGRHLSQTHQKFGIFCGDGHVSHAVVDGFMEVSELKPGVGDDLFQTFTDPGKPLCLPKGSVYNTKLPHDLALLENLERGLGAKGASGQIAIILHAPCGMATMFGFSFVDVIEHGMKGKRRIQAVFEPFFSGTIGCYVAVHHAKKDGGLKHALHYVDRTAWLVWLEIPKNSRRRDSWLAHEEAIARDPGYIVTELQPKE